ncbi:MAG: peptidoglycan-binding protein [Clostridiales bacterium]|nr:peptidoglycan-binding protein [Clostridiales bacterium]
MRKCQAFPWSLLRLRPSMWAARATRSCLRVKAAVLAFQKANGLGADGIAGPLTWAKLG